MRSIIIQNVKFLVNFRTKIVLATLSFLNLLWILRRQKISGTRQENTQENKTQAGKLEQIKEIFFGMIRTLFKKRSNWLRAAIFLQILAYTFYYTGFKAGSIFYLYTRRTLGWGQEEFITYKVVMKTLGIFNLLVLLPLLKKFRISDINLVIGANLIQGVGYFIASLSIFSPSLMLVGKYISTLMIICKYYDGNC